MEGTRRLKFPPAAGVLRVGLRLLGVLRLRLLLRLTGRLLLEDRDS